jgi:hypothetical protein
LLQWEKREFKKFKTSKKKKEIFKCCLLRLLIFFFLRLSRRHARAENQHGLYTDITKEKEFMNITTSEKYVVGHFYHKDFRRCKIMDTHLEVSPYRFISDEWDDWYIESRL